MFPDRTRVWTDPRTFSNSCKFKCCSTCTFCSRAAAKERRKSCYCTAKSVIKICEQSFLCRSIVFCKTCIECPKCCNKSACRGQTEPFLENLGAGRKVIQMLKDRYTLPFQIRPNLIKSPTIVSCCVHPYKYLYLLEALHQLKNKNAVELVRNQESLGFYNRAIFGAKTKQQMETYIRSEQSKQVLQGRKIQNGNTRNDPDLPTDMGVGNVHRLQGRLLPHTHTDPVQKISEISYTGQNIPIQSSTL